MLRELLTRFRFLILRKPHREVDEELLFHLDQQTRKNIAAGMAPQEAWRQAVIAFGGVEVRVECSEQRPSYFIETLLQRHPLCDPRLPAQSGLHHHRRCYPHARHWCYDRCLQRGGSHPFSPASLCSRRSPRLGGHGAVARNPEFMMGDFYYDWQRNQKPFKTITSEERWASAT